MGGDIMPNFADCASRVVGCSCLRYGAWSCVSDKVTRKQRNQPPLTTREAQTADNARSAIMFEAFAERDYRRFWSAQFVSNIGSWMQGLAQGWLVYKLTDSPFLLGFVAFATAAPSLLFMLPAGVLADHFDRMRTFRASQITQALSALFIAISIYT